MTPEDFQKELDKNETEKKVSGQEEQKKQSLDSAKAQVIDAMVQSTKANMKHRENTISKVDIQNPIAEREDIAQAISAINNLAVLMLGNNNQPVVNVDTGSLAKQFSDLGTTLTELLTEIRNDSSQDSEVSKSIDNLVEQLKTLQVAPDPDSKKSLANVEKAIKNIDIKPVVNLPAPKVTVQGKDIDLSPVVGLLNNINDTLKKLPVDNDDSEIIAGLDAVQSSINNLTFPVPNYVLPFKDSTGKAAQVQLDASGNLPTSGGGLPAGAATAANQATEISSLSTIATNTGNGATSANQTNGSQQTKITDGTNIGNILKSDGTAVGQNAQIIASGFMSTGTISLSAGTQNTSWYDLGNYPWLSVEILTNTTPATLTFQTSGDASETNIRTTPLMDSQGTQSAAVNSTSSAVASFYGARTGRYFRISSNLAGGNTATLIITFYTTSSYLMGLGAAIAGSKTSNSAVPGTNNVGVLPGVANAAIQSWTEGNQVLASMDLAGNTRVLQVAATPVLTNIASSATSVNLLAANNGAKSRIIYNDSSAILYVKYGVTASTSSFTALIPANTLFEFPLPTYTGNVDGIWASATGNARITEVT